METMGALDFRFHIYSSLLTISGILRRGIVFICAGDIGNFENIFILQIRRDEICIFEIIG